MITDVTSDYARYEPPVAEPVTAPQPVQHTRRDRFALLGLLASTAVLYLWSLGASSYANEFYAAAVQAGTKSWKALFFGSFDSSNFITVDKPPLALWPMEISGRIFGFSSWSMLVPQAIMGVLTVWLLYATVRRWFGANAGLLAGGLLALTPVAVLMFRFNNPDAVMTLLIVAAAYCVTRAMEKASTRWLLLAGGAMGLSFLAKGLQPFTVLPALALAYLVAAPTSFGRRVLQLLGAGVALLVAAGWWVLAVDLTPAADRPYIGGSGNNTALGLAFGYNGLSRITGSSGGGGGGANFSGSTGVGRLFNSLNGGQIAWLLPTALIAVVALAAVTLRAPRTDRTRAALILWGGWLLITGAVLSFASGIIHTYYAIELAPAVAALVAIGAVTMWRHRSQGWARATLAIGVLVTGLWSYQLLHRTPTWHPWVADVVVLSSLVAAALLALPSARTGRGLVSTAVVASLVAIGGGSAAYAVSTASTPHTGSVPSAGPTIAGGGFGGGFGGPAGSRTGNRPTGGFPTGGLPSGGFPSGGFPSGGFPSGGFPGGAQGGPGGTEGAFPGGSGLPTGGTTDTARPTGGGGTQSANAAVTALLEKTTTKWAAATIGSQSAGPLELASGKAVMSIGGFNGGDAAPTLAQFEATVAKGEIGYFISGGGGFGGQGGQDGGSSAITSWVAQHYTATTVGGVTVYDLSKAAS